MLYKLVNVGYIVEFTQKLPAFSKIRDSVIVDYLARMALGVSSNILPIGWDLGLIKNQIKKVAIEQSQHWFGGEGTARHLHSIGF